MYRLGRIGQTVGSALAVVLVFCASSVMAETISSPSYKINGNLGGSFGGQTSSTSYKMSAIGGEAIVGNGQSGSYIIDQQQAASVEAPSLELSLQPSGLKAFYSLDENTGLTSKDNSSNANNGTLMNGATWTAGKMGSALNFDGTVSGQSFSVPDNSAFTMGANMTLSLWAYQDELHQTRYFASHSENGVSGGWSLRTGSSTPIFSRLFFYIADSPGDIGTNSVNVPNGTWTPGTWHHVAVVYDGTKAIASQRVKIYLDGVSKPVTMSGTVPATMQDSNAPLILGGTAGSTSSWNGDLDHFKLFNRSLSDVEIKAEYDAQNAGNGGSTGIDLGVLSPDASGTTNFDALVTTNNPYSLSISQDHDLRSPTTSRMPVVHTNTGDITRVPASQSNFTSLTLNKPANTANGDLLVAVVYFQNNGVPAPEVTAPSGWTRIGPAYNVSNRPGGIYVLPVPSASALTDASWAWSTSGAAGRTQGVMFRMTDAELDAYADAGNPSGWGTTATSTSLQYPSMTVANPGSSLLMGYWVLNTSAGMGLPTPSSSNLTLRDHYNTGTNTAVSNSQLGFATTGVSQGATGTKTIDFSSAPANQYGYAAAITGRAYDRVAPLASALANPTVWSEGSTKGLGFSLVSGPAIDAKWGNGTKFAAFPAIPTTVYTSNAISTMTKEVVSLRSRIAVDSAQAAGAYSNTVTITGTTIP
jgi:hypothetical protein